MRFLKLGCYLTGLLGAATLALATGAATADATAPSGWRISATIGSAASEFGNSDIVVTGPADAWTTWTCGPCPSGSQPKQNLMLHWNGGFWLIASHVGTGGSITGHFAHFAQGKWETQPIPNRGSLQSEPGALASVPGSRSMWAVGFLVDKSTPEFGEILRFSK